MVEHRHNMCCHFMFFWRELCLIIWLKKYDSDVPVSTCYSIQFHLNSNLRVFLHFILLFLFHRIICDVILQQRCGVYRLSRACVLTAFSESGKERSQTSFIMPELKKLFAEAKSGSLSVLLVTFGMHFLGTILEKLTTWSFKILNG